MSTDSSHASLGFHDPARLIRQLAHDLRSPLNAITATSDMFMEAAYGDLSEKQGRAMQRVQRNGQRMALILEHFTLYVKAEAGESPLQQEPFDPYAVIRAAVDTVRAAAAEHALAVNFSASGNLPATLSGDAEMIRLICLALLWNAVSFTAEGSLDITSTWDARTGWTIRVTDSGGGLDPEVLPRLFTPFCRGATPLHIVPTAGCGLGLAVARAVAVAMGGRLTLAATSPSGSTFALTLPLKR